MHPSLTYQFHLQIIIRITTVDPNQHRIALRRHESQRQRITVRVEPFVRWKAEGDEAIAAERVRSTH